MNCVSCDICVYHLWFVFFPSGVFLSSRGTGACPVTTDLIMQVNVRTTTTTTIPPPPCSAIWGYRETRPRNSPALAPIALKFNTSDALARQKQPPQPLPSTHAHRFCCYYLLGTRYWECVASL